MHSQNITEALVSETGPMALVVLFTAALAVGLAKWVLDSIADARKDKS